MNIRKLGTHVLVLTLLVGGALLGAASADSKARIVRLSNVEGGVEMDRGDGFQRAFLNLPVVEGSRIRTGSDGRAEIEFEDGSLLHLVTRTEVYFTHLSANNNGDKVSILELSKGRLYANKRSKNADRITVNFARESIALIEPARVRIDLDQEEATVAVLKGDIDVASQAGNVQVTKKHSVTFDLANNDAYALAKNYEEEPSDDWDKEQTEYHDRYASNKTYDPSSPYAYGMSDMNYYGAYSNIPGYGWGWQPYFVNAAWSPFQDGAWMWYPGSGYMWVSAYPWGWTPYRYGSWSFAPGYGWFWQPGYWNTWYPAPQLVNPPTRTVIPQPPVRTRQTVMVGRGLVTNYPSLNSPRRVVINPGSAGFGIPRGSVRDLNRAAHDAQKNDRPVVVRAQPTVPVNPPTPSRTISNSNSNGPARTVRSAPPSAPTMSAPRMSSPPVRTGKPH